MKKVSYGLCVLAVAGLPLTSTPAARGAELCRKRSGIVVVRKACRRKEAPLDLAQFGALGPKRNTGARGEAGPPGSIQGAAAGGT